MKRVPAKYAGREGIASLGQELSFKFIGSLPSPKGLSGVVSTSATSSFIASILQKSTFNCHKITHFSTS